jgi:Spy/CpxP family protein refolding chaperone
MSTTRTTLVFLAALLLATKQASAQTPSTAASIPPDAEHAKNALAKSPRHGEWVDVWVRFSANG